MLDGDFIELPKNILKSVKLRPGLAQMLLQPGTEIGGVGKPLDLPFQQLGRLDLDAVGVAQAGDEDVARGFRARENCIAQPTSSREAFIIIIALEAAAPPAIVAGPPRHQKCAGRGSG